MDIMDNHQILICEQLNQLERQVTELKQRCEHSVEKFQSKIPNYNELQNQLIALRGITIKLKINILIVIFYLQNFIIMMVVNIF